MLQQGSVEEFFRENSTEVVVPSLENSEVGAITESWRDASTELVIAEIKQSKGWCTETEHGWYLPSKAVVASIECNQTLHHFPCGEWKLSCKEVA